MIRTIRVFVPVGAVALLLSEILLIASSFLIVTLLLLRVDPAVFLLDNDGLLRIGVATASMLFGLYFEDLYSHIYVKSRVLLLQQLCLTAGIALVLQGLLSYVNDNFRLPLWVMIPGSALIIVALFAWRIVYSALVLRMVGAQRILFVGANPLIQAMAGHIDEHPELGMRVLGYVDDGAAPGSPQGSAKVLGPLDSRRDIAAEVLPDRVVVGLAERRQRMPIQDLLQLRFLGLPIEEAAAAYEQLCGRVLLSELHPSQFLLSTAFRPRPDWQVYETLANWFIALILAVLSAPLLLLAAALLKLANGGPVLSRSRCLGLAGRPFTLYRLRLPGDGARSRGVARMVHRWKLDALPELWNILRGEMNFVGPRPDRPEFVHALTELIPFYRQRCYVKPGLTGWAQINLPPDQPAETLRQLEYDFYYLKNRSRGLDTYIVLHTLKELLIPST